MSHRLRLGVLVSGSGTNLQALLDACSTSDYPAEVGVVISNVAGALALERARRAGVPTAVLEHGSFASRADFDRALAELLRQREVGLVCLAGFMRVLGPSFLGAFPGRILNVHPSLLPAFPGLHGPRQALGHGVKITGCTVHFVDEGTDTGPILAQAAVPVLPDDDEAALAARILQAEHRLYPLAVRLVAEGKVSARDRRVTSRAAPALHALSLHNPGTLEGG